MALRAFSDPPRRFARKGMAFAGSNGGRMQRPIPDNRLTGKPEDPFPLVLLRKSGQRPYGAITEATGVDQ
jgi:hypothetical protein